MTVGTVKTVALSAVVFCVAAFASWTVKQALPHRFHPPSSNLPLSPPAASVRPESPSLPLEARVALAEALADADATRLREIATRLLETECRDIRVWRTLFECWVKLAPQEAWAFAKRHPAAKMPASVLFADAATCSLREAVIEQWGKADPVAARAALGGPAAPEFMALVTAAMEFDVECGFRLLGEALPIGASMPEGPLGWSKDQHIARLARKNPALALEWARRLDSKDSLGPVLIGWVANDPVASRTWLDQQAERAAILTQAADFMGTATHRYEPQVFDLILASLPPGNAKAQSIQRILEKLASVDPDLAVKEAKRSLRDSGARAEALAKIAAIVASGDPSRAWGILSHLESSACGTPRTELPETEVFVAGETRCLSPPMDYQQNLTSSPYLLTPGEVKSSLLSDMIWTDKEQTLRCLAQCPPENLAAIGGQAIKTWAAHDPEEAAAWLAPKLGTHATTLDISTWFEHSNLTPQEMRTLAESLTPGGFRDAFAAWSAGELAAEDPAAALDFARTSDDSAAALAEAYQVWAGAEPEAAMQHLARDPEAPPAAWASLIETAGPPFSSKITELIEALPHGAARDAGLTALIVNDPYSPTPLTSASWACGIEDENSRSRTLNIILNRTSLDLRLARDDSTAKGLRATILAAHSMPDAEKQRWLARIERELTAP